MTVTERGASIEDRSSKTRHDTADPIAASDLGEEQLRRAELQTELAIERTIFAGERTYAAWVRTGLAALASGVGARPLLQGAVPDFLAKSTGAMLILFAVFCFVVGIRRELTIGTSFPRSRARHLPLPVLLIMNGFLVAVAMTVLAGMAIGR